MALQAKDLSVRYQATDATETVALDRLDLSVADGEFLTIIGPSGCGKSTLLHCMAGLLSPTSGEVAVDGETILSPNPRQAAIVFQDHTLLPWMSVVDNVTLGLKFEGVSKEERREQGYRMLELVGLEDWGDSYSRQLSGGMRSRVSVARAMCMDPSILLMDEPFAALDEQTRRSLGAEMAALLTAGDRTVVMVTHSLDEAVIWGDRIIVLSPRPGRIVKEIRVPKERPRPLDFVADPMFGSIRAELFGLLESVVDSPSIPGDTRVTSGELA